MKRLLGLTFALVFSASATPVLFTGSATIDPMNHSLSLSGLGTTWAFSNATPDWFSSFLVCNEWATQGCDLSYNFQVISSAGISFFASDGTTSTSPFTTPPGRVAGQLAWSASPVWFASPPAHGTTVTVPITFTGRLLAWTPEEFVSNGAPFFDYVVSGGGALTASVASADSSSIVWLSGRAALAGAAQQTPEPAAWILILTAGLLLVGGSRARSLRH